MSDLRAVAATTTASEEMSVLASRRRIRFYRTADSFGEFSNFAPFPIRVKGRGDSTAAERSMTLLCGGE